MYMVKLTLCALPAPINWRSWENQSPDSPIIRYKLERVFILLYIETGWGYLAETHGPDQRELVVIARRPLKAHVLRSGVYIGIDIRHTMMLSFRPSSKKGQSERISSTTNMCKDRLV